VTSETPRKNGVQSVALWLGPPDRPLFAWLDLPEDGLVAGAAIVCPSLGLESAYSARALRDLAHRLAASGWAALRVDYAGTGDSAGTWTDPDLVAEWRSGIRSAIAYARQLGAPRIGVVALRVGATLVAAELSQGDGVDDLVLWDPCVTGRAFLREQRSFWAFVQDQASAWGSLGEGEVWGSGGASEEGSVEAPGVMFSAATVAELEPLAIPSSDRNLASRELVLARQGRKLGKVLEERRALPHIESVEIVGQDELLGVNAITPDPTLDKIVSWLTAPGGLQTRVESPKRPAMVVLRTNGRPPVLERPVTLGPARLFGILSEPADHADPSEKTIVFLNTGRIGHHGPAGLWVNLAREWAAEGFRCLRVDLSGIGDSPTRPGRTELVEFPADALEDMADLRQAITEEGSPELVFVGLCSGGYHAIEAALAAPLASICVVNPVLASYREGQQPERRFEPNQAPGFSDREAWGATRPWMSRAMLRLAPLRTAMQRVPGSWWILKRLLVTASPTQTFDRLAQSGVDVLVVAGTAEAHQLRRGEQRRYRALARTGFFSMDIVPRLEHSLLERTGRDRVSALLHAHLTRAALDKVGSEAP
jgi:alpha-beta hydrolase superfamily lysophospholipase